MTAFTILEHRHFMSLLLASPAFDRWAASEGSITTFCTFSIEGAWQRSFLDPEGKDPKADRDYAPWGLLRGHCLGLIKGKKAPLSFRFVLMMPRDELPAFLAGAKLDLDPEGIYGLYLNVSFRDGSLTITTGSSLKAFSLDKSLDRAFDAYAARLLDENGIRFEQA